MQTVKWWIWRCWDRLQPVVEHLVRVQLVLFPTWPFLRVREKPYDGFMKRHIVEMYPWVAGPPKTLAEMLAEPPTDFGFYMESPQPTTWRRDDHS